MSGKEKIRAMADLLLGGASLTNLPCPACSSPLLKLKNKDLWCEQCQKKVVVAKEGYVEKEQKTLSISPDLSDLKIALTNKIVDVGRKIVSENDAAELQKLISIMLNLIDCIEKLNKIFSG